MIDKNEAPGGYIADFEYEGGLCDGCVFHVRYSHTAGMCDMEDKTDVVFKEIS